MLGKFKRVMCPPLEKLQNETPLFTRELPNSPGHLDLYSPESEDLRNCSCATEIYIDYTLVMTYS